MYKKVLPLCRIHTEDQLFQKARTMSNSLENYNGNDPELLWDEMRAEFAKVDEELERKKERIAQLERERHTPSL